MFHAGLRFGASGRKYRVSAYMFGTHFGPGAGNFFYPREIRRGQYVPIYVGQTADLSEALKDNAALKCIIEGRATHVDVRFTMDDEAARIAECEDLVLSPNPLCKRSSQRPAG
jgi:hypothetical protein